MKHPQVALGEVADLIRGITYKPSDVCDATAPSAVACMRTKNVQEVLDESDIVWIPASIIRSSSKYLKAGDILVSSANSWNLVGKGCWVPELRYPASAGGFISILRGNKAVVDLRYLYHWFISPQTQAKLRSYSNKTTNISNLDHSRTLGTELPLPPLEEQRRIAAILDKAAQVRCLLAKKELAIASLMQSAFVELFGHPQEASVGSQAPVVTLGECCTLFSGGTLPAGEDNTGQEGGFLLLKVSDMNLPGNERSLKTSNLWSSKPGANSATCPAGSLVIPKRGGAIGTNKKRVVDRDAVLDPNLMALAPKEGMMTTEYLFGWFSFLDLSSITSGSSVPQLNKRDLSPLKVVLPPMETQSKYKEIALRVSLMSESLRKEAISLQTLSQVLHRVVFGSANPE
jgi:type I restriction enzyme S subunit